MPSRMRAVWRSLNLGRHIGWGFARAIYLQLRLGRDWHQTPVGKTAACRWMQGLTRILGLRVHVEGLPLSTPALIVANHISWLDIIALASYCPVRFLAKDSVRRWPVFGALAALTGTLFFRRGTAAALRETNQRLCRHLAAKQRLAIFPEGTSGDGRGVKPFHPALFEAARAAHCPVQPLAIRYRRNGGVDPIAPYFGDDTFILHLWRILCTAQTEVQLRFCTPLSSREPRKVLAARSHALITAALESATEMLACEATPADATLEGTAA